MQQIKSALSTVKCTFITSLQVYLNQKSFPYTARIRFKHAFSSEIKHLEKIMSNANKTKYILNQLI